MRFSHLVLALGLLLAIRPAAAAEKPAAPKSPVGMVLMSIGSVYVKRDSILSPLKINNKVFNDDEISAGESGKVKIVFTDESTITLLPKAKTKISHQPASDTKSASSLVNLFYGTVRSVVPKSENGRIKFKVDTPSAVAEVRSTDFLTTYYESSKITKVQTLEGSVELQSHSGATKSMIPAGHYASFVVDTNGGSDSASMKYVDNGFITPLGYINPEQRKRLDELFDFTSDRKVATTSAEPICQTPTALFNQCSYQCINNPKSADHCSTEKPNVRCLRKRCNANGVWAEETRLPASHYEKCPARGIVVERCDY